MTTKTLPSITVTTKKSSEVHVWGPECQWCSQDDPCDCLRGPDRNGICKCEEYGCSRCTADWTPEDWWR